MNKFFIIIFTLISSVSFGETINSLDIHYSEGLFYKKGIQKPFTGIVEGNSVGRLVKQKNFETLIKGFSLFSKDYPNYKLVILGDGPEKEKLKQLIANLNCDKQIILRGWIKNTNK